MKNVLTKSSSSISRCCRIVVASLLVSIGASVTQAEDFTNAVSGIKYTEKLTRKVKFVHAGPFIGDYALLFDSGSFTIQGTVSIQGLAFTEISGNTEVRISMGGPTLEYSTSVHLGDDPKYTLGRTKATITKVEDFDDKPKKVESISVKIDPIGDTITVTVRGRYTASTYAPNTLIEDAGRPALADRELGQATHEISEVMFLYISIDAGVNTVEGVAPFTVLGQTRRTDRTDSEIGTYPAYLIAIAGLGNR